jgi:hypothetical protein
MYFVYQNNFIKKIPNLKKSDFLTILIPNMEILLSRGTVNTQGTKVPTNHSNFQAFLLQYAVESVIPIAFAIF